MLNYDLTFDDGESRRLDVFVAEKIEITRSYAAKLIENAAVTVNGKVATKNMPLLLLLC